MVLFFHNWDLDTHTKTHIFHFRVIVCTVLLFSSFHWIVNFGNFVSFLFTPDVKSWLVWKDPDSGKDWGQEEKTTEDETVGWHHRLNGHAFGWTPGVGDGQGGLGYCSSWGRKVSDATEWLNWTELKYTSIYLSVNLLSIWAILNTPFYW